MVDMKKVLCFMALMSLLFAVEAQQKLQHDGRNCCQQEAACKQSCSGGQKCCQPQKGRLETVSAEMFAQQIRSRKVVLIDVRSPKEYASGHIKGAKNIEWGNDFKEQIERIGLKKNGKVAVYCRSGRRSRAAANVLVEMGFAVVELEGGILAWEKGGNTVVK